MKEYRYLVSYYHDNKFGHTEFSNYKKIKRLEDLSEILKHGEIIFNLQLLSISKIKRK